MPGTAPKPRAFTAPVVANLSLGRGLFVLRLGGCEPLAESEPGQFVMVRGDWGRDPLLPRAFSILGVLPRGEAEVLVKAVGRGTAQLARAVPGARLRVLGPLGTSFPAVEPDGADLLVAGGVGVAPLLHHAARAARAGRAGHVRLLYGGRTAADLVLLDRFAAVGVEVALATEDGSAGARGRVTELLPGAIAAARAAGAPSPRLCACGPDPMLLAVAALARDHGLPALLSLEGEMACGIGVCLGCAVPAVGGGFRYACTHGPVMDAATLGGRFAAAPVATREGGGRP